MTCRMYWRADTLVSKNLQGMPILQAMQPQHRFLQLAFQLLNSLNGKVRCYW